MTPSHTAVYSNNQEFIDKSYDKYSVGKDDQTPDVLKSKEDQQTSKEYGCCEECWLTFGQSRRKEWKEGWRPDKDTLDRYKEKRRILIDDIFKLLEE